MKMTSPYLLVLAAAGVAASAFAKDNDLIQTRLKELTASAKPLADVGFVKAKDGCLWHISEQNGKPSIVRQLDASGKPYCERSTLIPSTTASPTTQLAALLERAIEPSAANGDPISLRDAECRYSGKLVRELNSGNSFAAAVSRAAGADTGRWHIDISTRTCGQKTETVKMRADLPKPPSLAGGGGVPSLPYGYEAGTKLTLFSNKYTRCQGNWCVTDAVPVKPW